MTVYNQQGGDPWAQYSWEYHPVRKYVVAASNFDVQISTEIQQGLVEHAKKKIENITESCLKEVREHAAKNPTAVSLDTNTVVNLNDTNVYYALCNAIKDLFQKKYGCVATFNSTRSPTSAKDSLLGDMGKNYSLSSYKLQIKWVPGNPYINPIALQTQLSYTAKDHLKKEWQAACEGRFTDITFVQQGEKEQSLDLASSKAEKKEKSTYKANKSKLQVHSEYFRTLFASSFKDSKEDTLEIPADLFESFKLLLEFIYLGEIASEQNFDFKQLLNFYRCADFYGVESAKEWCVQPMQKCFAAFSTDKKEQLIESLRDVVNEKNWQWFFDAAKFFPQVTSELLNFAKYNSTLAQFAKKSESKSSSSSSSKA